MTTVLQEPIGATFSDCRNYRYALWRIWDRNKPSIMFIGLNPSTANESKNDPTIRRVMEMAKVWGFGGIYMLNLFAWVSSDPKALLTCGDPIGKSDMYLQSIAKGVSEIVFCWGAFPEAKERAKKVIEMFPNAKALIVNKDGSPRHPLYVKKRTPLVLYSQQTHQP